jgi:hypothetical protein
MKTLHACLISSVAFGLSVSASAQSADARYCSALADKYSGVLIANNQQQSQDPQQVSVRAGIDQCRVGNTAVGMPLLESNLRTVGLDLPTRGATATPTLTRVSHGHAKGG